MLLAAFAGRFWQLDERGLYGSDVVYYTHLAQLWSEGERVYSLGGRRAVYRPVVLWLFAASIDLLGFEDSSIKKLNAGLDGLNVVLVFALAWLIARAAGRHRIWAATASAVLYAALPLAIYVSRTELTHTISTFFTLLMVLLAALWFGFRQSPWRGRALLAGSGLAAAAAALSHEELLFAAAGVAAWITLSALRRTPGRWRWRAALSALALFTVPLVAGVSGMVAHHWDHVGTLASTWLGGAGGGGAQEPERPQDGSIFELAMGQLEKTARFSWNATVATSSVPAALLFLAALLLMLFEIASQWRKREVFAFPWLETLPLFVLGSYLGLFALLFPYLFPRLFLPLVPLVLSFTVVVGTRAWAGWRWDRGGSRENGAAVSVVAVVLVVVAMAAWLAANVEQFSRRQGFMARDYSATWASVLPDAEQPSGVGAALAELRETSYRQSWARQVYELMAGQVGPDSRLLVASSLMYPHPARRELQVGYYFGDDAVYLFDHDAPLAQLVEDLDVRWLLYSAHRADRRFLKKEEVRRYLGGGRWSDLGPPALGRPLGLSRQSFHLGSEYRALLDFVESADAEVFRASGTFALGEPPSFEWADESYVIYALPRRQKSRSSASASELSSLEKPREASTSR